MRICTSLVTAVLKLDFMYLYELIYLYGDTIKCKTGNIDHGTVFAAGFKVFPVTCILE